MSQEIRSVDWEKDIYSAGKQLNKWPYIEVVSAFHKEIDFWDNSRPPRILEVGCGAGNNLWALATLGYEVFGVDSSKSAIAFGKKRFKELGLKVELKEASMQKLPFDDGFFDFVLDRAAITQVPLNLIPSCVKEIVRVLNKSGKLYSFGLFGENHMDRLSGRLLSNGSFDNFTDGVFAKVGLTSFFNMDTLTKLFNDFSNLEIKRHTTEHPSGEIFEEFSLVGLL